MKLSLSVRCAEAPKRKDQALIPFDALASCAAEAGFDALCMRASVVDVDADRKRIATVRDLLARHRLAVSMVTGDVALAANGADATRALDDITPYLDLADALGARSVRVMAHTPNDIERLRRAADLAEERGMMILHQTHWGTLCETIEETLALDRALDHPAFGITLDCANLLACAGEAMPAQLDSLIPRVRNVYFQNLRLDPASPTVFPCRHRGAIGVHYLALDDACGIDLTRLVNRLHTLGFDGWFTVHQPLRDGQTVTEGIDEAARVVKPLIDATRSDR